MYTWEEDLTEDDSKLFDGDRYVGKVAPVSDAWKVLFQPDPDSLPPSPYSLIGSAATKVAAQSALIKYWEARKL